MQANDILFRCSSLGHIMGEIGLTEKQSDELISLQTKPKLTDNQQKRLAELVSKRDNPELSQSCKTHLVDVFIYAFYDRREYVTSKYLEKGNEREEDSITLYSRATNTFFTKNTTRLNNDFITGEPDLFLGEDICRATETTDTKTSWSLHTFQRSNNKELDPMYYWQGMGYMFLTGAVKHNVAHCLVNGTAKAIINEKAKLAYQMDIIDPYIKTGDYLDRCRQIEINHIFDLHQFLKEYPGFDFDNELSDWRYDIPFKDRIHVFQIDRNPAEIAKICDRVRLSREYIQNTLIPNQNT